MVELFFTYHTPLWACLGTISVRKQLFDIFWHKWHTVWGIFTDTAAMMSITKTFLMITDSEINKWQTRCWWNTGCCKTSVKLWKHLTKTLYEAFFMFLGSFDCQIWAIFPFGTLLAYGWKKNLKIWSWKKVGSNWQIFWFLNFLIFGHTFLQIIKM